MSAPPKGGLAILFGKKGGHEERDDGPSDEDVKGAKSDAFNAFFDAIHSKDREGAHRAWKAMQGEDEEEEEMPPSEREEMGEAG